MAKNKSETEWEVRLWITCKLYERRPPERLSELPSVSHIMSHEHKQEIARPRGLRMSAYVMEIKEYPNDEVANYFRTCFENEENFNVFYTPDGQARTQAHFSPMIFSHLPFDCFTVPNHNRHHFRRPQTCKASLPGDRAGFRNTRTARAILELLHVPKHVLTRE